MRAVDKTKRRTSSAPSRKPLADARGSERDREGAAVKDRTRRDSRMPAASDEMKRIAAMIEDEVAAWPDLSVRPMFGMSGLYRGKKIFAALPRTRSVGTPNSFIFRFDPMPPALVRRAKAEERIHFSQPGARWYSFEVTSAEDLKDALWWLSQAYEATPLSAEGRRSRTRATP